MLRLSPPGRERLLQSPLLSAGFGGSEANVAVSLAHFGHYARLITALPPGPLGDACIKELKRYDVDTEFILRQGTRMGIYFAETGANQRSSQVLYDREFSSMAETQTGDFDWDEILDDVDWFHTSGITPAISESAAALTFEAVKFAKSRNIIVSLDFNYRGKLWNGGKRAPEVMREIVKYADIGIGNEEDCQKSLGMKIGVDLRKGPLDVKVYEKLTHDVLAEFPNLTHVAITMRESFGADINAWSAGLRNKNGFLAGTRYSIQDVVDRIGSGDAFAAALIHGLSVLGEEREALEFAVAASCLKHTIPGDFNLVSEQEVISLMKGDHSGRIKR